MYRSRSHGFEVVVTPTYLDGASDPEASRYVWAYDVLITNEGDRPARLVGRHWDIVDATGRTEVVDGPGVVGEMPHLGPGESFEYRSGCPLETSSGAMSGHYVMIDDEGESFHVAIPAFSLDLPNARRTLN